MAHNVIKNIMRLFSHTSGNARATRTCLYHDFSCIVMTKFLYQRWHLC